MRRWMLLLLTLITLASLMSLALAACGGDDDGGDTDDAPAAPADGGPANRPPEVRSRPLPEGDPYAFTAPFSVGNFVQRSTTGRVTATQTGGLQAIYSNDSQQAVLTVYHFPTIELAQETVRFTLSSATISRVVEQPTYTTRSSFAMAQDRYGGAVAVWSRLEWVFIVRTTGGIEPLNQFLEVFPY